MTTARLLVIQHEDDCPPEWFGAWWQQQGLGVDVIPAHTGAPVPDELGDHAALVVLGGEMGANDDAEHAWLARTRSLIRTVVGRGQPFLGICLGHQLAAVALGGEVRVNEKGPATGLTPVVLNTDGRKDPLLGDIPDGARAIQWNDDVVTRLPEGSTQLSTAPDGSVQAARYGAQAWGVQFHPETSPQQFRRWTVAKPSAESHREDGLDVAAVSAAIADAEAELRRTWRPLAERFGELVGSGTV